MHVYLIMYTYKIIMHTCIDNYVYMQDDHVYMQDNFVYIIRQYFFNVSQNLCRAMKKLRSDVPSGPPYFFNLHVRTCLCAERDYHCACRGHMDLLILA